VTETDRDTGKETDKETDKETNTETDKETNTVSERYKQSERKNKYVFSLHLDSSAVLFKEDSNETKEGDSNGT
jgi:hypothetical protein